MSIEMDEAADAILQAARESASLDELSDLDVDGDGSSSLSEIEYKDSHQDEEGDVSDDQGHESEDENDSEAETERLEESPNKIRTQKDVVLSSHNDNQIYERSPSKLNNQLIPNVIDDEEEEDLLSEDDISILESSKSSNHDDVGPEPTTAATSLEDSAGEGKRTLSVSDADTRKRKRSIMASSGLDEDSEEPLRKRTGSVLTPGDEYAIDEEEHPEEEGGTSNPISGDISADEQIEEPDEEAVQEIEEPIIVEEEAQEVEAPVSPKKRGRRKKKVTENGIHNQGDEPEDGAEEETLLNGDNEVRVGEEDNAEHEADDEAEAALKNEEELERKRIAAEQLLSIEKQFATFRDRLFDDRLQQLNREEAMLREENPTHPEYQAMMKSIAARRDERYRVSDKLREYEIEALKTYAVAIRSQILVQYQQEAREIRERKLEDLGNQWYKIQHDRRSSAGSVPDYTIRFPTRRSQQIQNQVAYSNEVSILSGVAKYVGFPAAPPMGPATDTEVADDFAKMGRSRHPPSAQATGIGPLQELAALRSAGSTSRFKPAEEQFIEQTPWANPQHPSHAHLLQRQTSAQQVPRTTSPFPPSQSQPRRHSHQPGSLGPVSGTFASSSSSLLQHTNGLSNLGGRISPHNPFSNSSHSHTIAPSPLGSRQPSLSPQQNRPPPTLSEQQQNHSTLIEGSKQNGTQQSPVAVDLW